MGVHFFKCANVSILHYGHERENIAVNLSLVFSIRKSRLRWSHAPDYKPSLCFYNQDNNLVVEWAYQTEEQRDEDFERIMKERS